MQIDMQQSAEEEAQVFMEKLHALNPRPSEEEAYDLLFDSGIGWGDVDLSEYYNGPENDWDKDWPTDAIIRARVAKNHWSLVRKSVKAAPIVKYWFDVTMHKKYVPGGVGYFEAKADFVQQQAKTDGDHEGLRRESSSGSTRLQTQSTNSNPRHTGHIKEK